MRRRTLPLVLAALLLVPTVPAAAVEPVPDASSSATPALDPAGSPAPAPSDASSIPPTAEPSAAPTDAVPTPEPSPAEPSPDSTSAPEPSSDPAASPEPTPDAAGPSPSIAPAAPTTDAKNPRRAGGLDATNRWIVLLNPDADPAAVRDRHASRSGVSAERLFRRAFRGFAGTLTNRQVELLRADPEVTAVIPDEIVEVAAQTIPTGVSRVGARASTSTVARINGIDERVDADVAIVDTGIDPGHRDLNVAGGYNCSTSDRNLWRDVQGHGTHVAGTVGAIDNGSGVVGVAPGVRLWAVKILNDDGFGYLSWYVCGLDWIAAQRDPVDPSRPLFESVNMSVAKWGSDGGNCGLNTNDILHQAICRVTKAGIPVVAAAANDSTWASKRVPAAYNEVITVSALADTDGRAGGSGGPLCWSWGGYDRDDTFADFSNYGGDVDLIAPGKCIWSTLPGDRYGYSSGTSMAAPAVAGAVALYKASRPWASPAVVRNSLQLLGSTNWFSSTDPDSVHERLLNVARLGPAGTFSVSLGTPAPVGEAGSTVTIPVTINRSATHFETLRLLATTPPGFAVALSKTSLSGFTAKSATVTVTVPPLTPAGRYPVTVLANEGVRTSQATVDIVIEHDAPSVGSPAWSPVARTAISQTHAVVRLTWPAATDPTSEITAYELQHATDGGAWSTIKLPASARSLDRRVSLGHRHQFRVRARDAAGNWSPWASARSLSLRAVDDAVGSRSSGWVRYSYQYAYANTFSRTTTAGARIRWTVTARTVAVVAATSPRRGWYEVWVDGVYQGRISLYSEKAANRQLVWTRSFATDATRVVELRFVRTSTRYQGDIDALLAFR